MYPPEKIQLPPNVPDELKAKAQMESQGYYAHCTALDQCFGQIMATLAENGLADNTIVVFTSDHGEMMGSHGIRPFQKQLAWDEASHVPLLLSYPAVLGRQGRDDSLPLTTPDILPTLLGLAGIAVPKTIEGEDLSALIRKVADVDRAALYMAVAPWGEPSNREYRAIRTNHYTYVRSLQGPWLLFDDRQDPYQMNNLVQEPKCTALRQTLDARLLAELKKIGDDFRPADYYVRTWGLELAKHGSISYAPDAKVQSPHRTTVESR
jgi:arylsulfatase A-like enzyme